MLVLIVDLISVLTTVTHSIEPTGPETIDLPWLEALALKQAHEMAVLGIIPRDDTHECIQRIMADEIQNHLDPGCTVSDPRGEDGGQW